MVGSIGKWNYKTKEYDEYKLPTGNVKLICNDMDEEIVCTSCGKDTTFGVCYTSREIHTKVGFGYPVCEECYAVESERKDKYRE